MNNPTLVEEHYQRLSLEELLFIAGNPASLDPEAIPLLQKALIARNHPEEALALTQKPEAAELNIYRRPFC